MDISARELGFEVGRFIGSIAGVIILYSASFMAPFTVCSALLLFARSPKRYPIFALTLRLLAVLIAGIFMFATFGAGGPFFLGSLVAAIVVTTWAIRQQMAR